VTIARPTRRHPILLVFLSLIAVAPWFAAMPRARAAVPIVVTTTADEIAQNGRCSLREAIISANTDTAVGGCEAGSGADTITFAAPSGVYAFSPHLAGNDDAAHLGDLDVTSPVTIRGRGPTRTIVDARGMDRVFDLHGNQQPPFPVSLTGLTVRNGIDPNGGGGSGINAQSVWLSLTDCAVSDNTSNSQEGTGLALSGSAPATVDRCRFVDNHSQRGGAIGAGSDLAITDSSFIGNTSGGGGALYVRGGTTTVSGSLFQGNISTNSGGAIWNTNMLVMTDSSLVDNHADNEGGAIVNAFHSGTLDNVTFQGNSAPNGGAIYNDRADLVVRRSRLEDNAAGRGGGVYASGFGDPLPTVEIDDSVFDGNTADVQGGGLFTFGTDTLSGDTFTGNEAGANGSPQAGDGDGDAIYSTFDFDDHAAVLSIANSTISGNGTQLLQGTGGGLHNANGNVAIRSSTFDGNAGDNQGGSGGSIYNDVSSDGSITVTDTILADPLSGGNCGGTRPTSLGHNLEFGDGIGNSPCLGNPADPTDQNADPALGPLQDNGGPTPTMALGAASAALGQGASCPADDQRGVPRAGPCDVGAYQRVVCFGMPVDVVGTAGPDTIRGGSSDDTILGLGGDDVISAGGGNDLVCAGSGSDSIDGGPGSDAIGGGTGNDTAVYSQADHVNADLATATATGAGMDNLQSVENVTGSPGDDTLLGNAGPNRLTGGGGDDHLDGRAGRDTCAGGPGHDTAAACEVVSGVP
jgi:CSLREA domain-containing protein